MDPSKAFKQEDLGPDAALDLASDVGMLEEGAIMQVLQQIIYVFLESKVQWNK